MPDNIILAAVGAASFGVTFGGVPVVRRLMLMRGILDIPNHRSSHVLVVPRGGGAACLFGVISGGALASALGASFQWGPLAACAALGMIGLADDKYQISAAPRLVGQVAVGGLLGFFLGGLSGLVLGAVVMPFLVNVVNFMDGINGITALTMATWGLTALSLAGAVPTLALIGALTTGAAAGFLPWNAFRPSMFLGDVGSYLFGALAASGIMLAAAEDRSIHILMAPLSVYTFDVLVTLIRRMARRENLLEAHRSHIYQRLVRETGFAHIAIACYVVLLSVAVTLLAAELSARNLAAIAMLLGLYFASPWMVVRSKGPWKNRERPKLEQRTLRRTAQNGEQ